jgi:DNA-binding NtrC family response regulator
MADPDGRPEKLRNHGASTHGGAESRTRLGIVWTFPFPTSLTTRFEGTRIVLGRSDDCDVVLEGAEISRRHAEVLRVGSEWVIHDLGSRNGVHVDAERVESSILRTGDVLRLGEWIGIVRSFEPEAESAPPRFRQLSPDLVGGAHLQNAVADAERVAQTRVRVVVQGETGAGKKQLSHAIHQWSGRTGKFVVVSCAALPGGLEEGELFGCAGGAVVDHIQAADRGTLLLDEVADMPLSLQPKLLGALEEQSALRPDGPAAVSIDVRVVVTTQEPLERAVEQRRLRADLCARLSGLTIVLPPLRERREDIPGLFAHLLQRHWHGPLPAVDPRLVECLCRHHWPYNVRELDQLSSYLGEAHAQESCLRIAHLPKSMRQTARPEPAPTQEGTFDDVTLLEAVVRQDLEKREQRERELRSMSEALRLCHGNVSRAARVLGISRQKIYRMMQSASSAELEELRPPSAPSEETPADAKS